MEYLARGVVAASAKREGRLVPETLEGVRRLLGVVNSYYIKLIGGHSAHPVDIERAMRQDYSADQEKRDLQIESRIHIEAQEEIAERLRRETDLNVASPEFLLWVHEQFSSRLPERLRWVRGDDGKRPHMSLGWMPPQEFKTALARAEGRPIFSLRLLQSSGRPQLHLSWDEIRCTC